jgi:hypothetical protein
VAGPIVAHPRRLSENPAPRGEIRRPSVSVPRHESSARNSPAGPWKPWLLTVGIILGVALLVVVVFKLLGLT